MSGRPGWWHREVVGFPAGDLLLGLVVAVIGVGGVLTGGVDEAPRPVAAPVALVLGLAVAGRTRAPVLGVALASLAGIVQATSGASPGTLLSLMVYLLLAFSVGCERDEGWALVGGVGVIAGLWVQEWLDDGSDYLFILLVFGTAWLAGRALRAWRERATYAEQHQRDLARLAVAEERVRIARELHDVVANGLAVIAIQSEAAEAALARDPRLVAEPLRTIRASATGSLADMRQMLELLRATDEDETSPPAKGLADLPALVTAMRESGLPLDADIETRASCSAGVGLAAYRVVQEGLTNVLKHAGLVPTRLTVTATGDELAIRIASAAGSPKPGARPGGHGLLGLTERVRAAGGRITAEGDSSAGFVLDVRLPTGGPR